MADPFSNEPIPTDHLPRLSDDAFVPVDPRYLPRQPDRHRPDSRRRCRRHHRSGDADRSTGPAAADRRWCPPPPDGGRRRPSAEARRLAYQLREHDLSLRSGVITHRVESLPFSRVQHVNVHRGPIERSLGLATLHVSTAGPDISIPGLTRSDAERIELLVTERADVVDEDGGAPPPLPPPSPPPPPR